VTYYRRTFERQVGSLLARYLDQNGQPALSAEETGHLARRLCAVVVAKGLPRRLRSDEMGEPGELPPEDVNAIVSDVLPDGTAPGIVTDAIRQLVKACFYAEFKKCRESYHDVNETGECRRQELGRARRRISGSHCVDCPYWTALTPSQHVVLLSGAWCGEPRDFVAHREIFLPEDFREFRQTLRGWADEMQTGVLNPPDDKASRE